MPVYSAPVRDTKYVLDHVVGILGGDAALSKRKQAFGHLSCCFRKFCATLFEGQVVESGNAGVCHWVTFTKLIVRSLSAKIYHIL